jgi:hypothetical protein
VIGGFFPTFSPNGQRVAVARTYTVTSESGTTNVYDLVTYGIDGSDVRVVRANTPDAIAGMTWADNETLVWVESESATKVYRVKDAEGAYDNDLLSEVIMDCSLTATPIPAAIGHAMIRGGALFVASSYTNILGSTPSSYSVWRLGSNLDGTFECDQNAVTNVKVAGDDAHDYDVSRDGNWLLYFVTLSATETETSATHLYVRDLVNLGEPIALSATASTIASGAHFAANGRQIVWTDTLQASTTYNETTYERPQASRVIVANSDGSNKRAVVTVSSTPSQARMFHTGGNSACSVGGMARGNVAMPAGGLLALLSVVLWRRRRKW